jgi:hypothetical protein
MEKYKFTDKLNLNYQNSNTKLKELFIYLISEINKRFSVEEHYSTNKPDYRFTFLQNVIKTKENQKDKLVMIGINILPVKNKIHCLLRTNEIDINNYELEFKHFNDGKSIDKWREYNIQNQNEVNILLDKIIPQVIIYKHK